MHEKLAKIIKVTMSLFRMSLTRISYSRLKPKISIVNPYLARGKSECRNIITIIIAMTETANAQNVGRTSPGTHAPEKIGWIVYAGEVMELL